MAISENVGYIFIRLGGLHFIMSYMDSAGNIVSGRGLEEMWESVYTKGTVMTTGHASSRALCVLFLMEAALVKSCFKHKVLFM